MNGYGKILVISLIAMMVAGLAPLNMAGAETGARASRASDVTLTAVTGSGLPTSGEYESIAWGDFNKDGNIDFASGMLSWFSGGGSNAGLHAFINSNSGGTWTKVTTGLDQTGEFAGVATGDVNKDGATDIIAGHETYWSSKATTGIDLYTSDGAATPSFTSSVVATTGGYNQVCLFDFSNDGNLDVVGTSDSVYNSGVKAWTGNGATTWTAANTGLPTTGEYWGCSAGDLNKDGNVDLALGGTGANAVTVYLGNGGTSWTKATSTGLPASGTYWGTNITDVDKDGNLDIVVGSYSPGGIYAYTGNGASSPAFTSKSTNLPTAKVYCQVVTGDVDADGNKDIFGSTCDPSPVGVTLHLGNGGAGGSQSWTKVIGTTLPTTSDYGGAGIADIDKDGDGDLIIGGSGWTAPGNGLKAWKTEVSLPVPVAKVGVDQTTMVGDTVTLDGSTSTAPTGKTISQYLWNITAQPTGSAITFINGTSSKPSFVPNIVGDYKFTLSVKDDSNAWGKKEAQTNVTANPRPNIIPVANAGADKTAIILTLVELDGVNSTDDAPLPFYKWNITSKPDGSAITLTDSDKVKASFTPDLVGVYKFTLTVKDANNTWAKDDSITITVNPVGAKPPTAEAGPDLTIELGDTFSLNASASTDDMSVTAFKWTLASQPSGSSLVVQDAVSVQNLKPLIVGDYTFSLTVKDNDNLWSAADTMKVTVLPKNLEPEAAIDTPKDGADFLENEVIAFSAEGSVDPEDGPLDYEWTSSIDGKIGSEKECENNLTAGVHTITLAVTDDHGHTVTSAIDITVKPDLTPTVELSADKTTILKGDTVKFDASDSKDPEGKILLYLFDWGDNAKTSFQDQPKLSHKYTTIGTFEAFVTVKDPSEHTAISEALTIIVGAAPVGKIAIKSVSCTVGEPCEFDASGSTDEDGTIASYSYDFGAGETSGWVTTANVSHVFTTPGAHTVKLKVKDDTGFESTNSAQVDVNVADKRSDGGGGSASSGMGGSLLPLLLIIVIVVVVVAVVLMMRRKKPAPTSPAPPQPQLQPVPPPPPGYYPPAQPEPQPQQPPQYGYDQPNQYQQQPQAQEQQYDYSQQQQAYAEQPQVQEQAYVEQPRPPAFSYEGTATATAIQYQTTPTQ